MMKFLQTSFLKIVFLFLIFCCTLISCREIDLFEKNISIPNMLWFNNYNATGSFLVKDTNSTYNLLLVLRHTDDYQYNNIWLNIGLQAPGDTGLQYQKINIALGDDAQGWAGVGMNDIWEVRKVISGVPKKFIKAGDYNFSIAQLMRDNPLLQVISVGMSVQKAK
jgi:gliding motility-associated lipoprotein GldH